MPATTMCPEEGHSNHLEDARATAPTVAGVEIKDGSGKNE
jgi:hypothetical protein